MHFSHECSIPRLSFLLSMTFLADCSISARSALWILKIQKLMPSFFALEYLSQLFHRSLSRVSRQSSFYGRSPLLKIKNQILLTAGCHITQPTSGYEMGARSALLTWRRSCGTKARAHPRPSAKALRTKLSLGAILWVCHNTSLFYEL